MYHALQIQEVLLNIFSHCHPPALPALARTCRTFNDPALDLLWRELADASPLVRCLPEISFMSSPGNKNLPPRYSLSRSPTQAEWDVLLSYMRRIVRMQKFNNGLGWESITTFLKPPTAGPLFPNLRALCCSYTERNMHLLDRPFPSLAFLDMKFDSKQLFQNAIKSFPTFFPNIRQLSIYVFQLGATSITIDCGFINHWRSLQNVACPQVVLDEDALVHLSNMPRLGRLDFALDDTLPALDSPLLFSNLHCVTLHSEFLELVPRFLSHARLPVVTRLTVIIDDCPSHSDLSSFFASVRASNASNTIEGLRLNQQFFPPGNFQSSAHQSDRLLVLEDLQLCMALHNLCQLYLDIQWNVGLSDDEVTALVLAWPRLQNLQINANWGWNSPGGMTPRGLIQLLEIRRSLVNVALAIDTRNFVALPASASPADPGLTVTPRLSINVADSFIESDSVAAVAAFFCAIAIRCGPRFCFRASTYPPSQWRPEALQYASRWRRIRHRIDEVLGRRREEEVPDEVD